ncbi:uncharacterized protein [Henckelia pumila]|uniref:uncharacterized protein n=1 Tax=Henckelia pumila TaxID=405737 RepID=UPI003C6DE697
MFFRTKARFFEGYNIAGVVNNLCNLRQLALLLEFTNELDLLAVAAILDACPFLHKFHLSIMHPSTFDGKRAEKTEVRCHTELKEVEFSGFTGTKNEYDFVLYILENAVSLEQLTIFLHPREYEVGGDRWIVTPHSNPRDDKKKQRIIRERLKELTISKNVIITVVV